LRDLRRFRLKIQSERESDLVRNAVRLRDKRPEETLKMMFELIEFAVKLNEEAQPVASEKNHRRCG